MYGRNETLGCMKCFFNANIYGISQSFRNNLNNNLTINCKCIRLLYGKNINRIIQVNIKNK